ncbi:MAG: peptide-methionine (S)-S-oxide reductase MsrA [Planctomycetota bacterium]|nr:peptide-methionine (S)-S-oxide reductase MsrA [Planctomycetota bacterium]
MNLHSANLQKATFGAGCFWGVESTFREIPGVVDVAVGYAGGDLKNPTYEDVCTGSTGHAEVVEIEFDANQVSFQQLVDRFFDMHNPMTLNRQGPDVGTQYRSAVFYHDDAQRESAVATIKRLDESGKFNRPIVTQVEAAGPFYRAEEYHQNYLGKRGLKNCHL